MQQKLARMRELTTLLNQAAKAYYQESREIMPNVEYDRLYDELQSLEQETGVTLSGSPTAMVGYEILSELPKERPALIIDTPCHIAALYRTIPETMKHILTLEQACSGIMSDLPLKAYSGVFKHTEESPVIDYNLAAKHYVRSGIRAEFTHADGSLTTRYNSLCPLIQAYQASDSQRPSCYACTFRDNIIGLADLSLAVARLSFAPDFAPEDKIISVLSANSQAGQDFYRSCSEAFEQRPLEDSILTQCFPHSRLLPQASRSLFYQRLHGEQPTLAFKPYRKKK